MKTNGRINKRRELAALAFTIVFPSVLTLGYFVVFAGHPLATPLAGVGKVLQFGFPALWVFVVAGEKFQWKRPKLNGIPLGAGFGVFIAALMIALAMLVLKPSGFLDEPAVKIQLKIRELHLDSLPMYLGASVFYCVGHALMEEYYWRWFVFKRLQPFIGVPSAIVISSLGFMAHHVIVLAVYFRWDSPGTYIFSACVAIGGAVWAWIYSRSDSLYAPWVSHMCVDTGIFTLGYVLSRELFV